MMEIGALGMMRKGENPFRFMAECGMKTAQIQNWNMDLLTEENAQEIVAFSRESGIRIAAFWAGYSGRNVWGFLEGPATIGLVPEHTRARRVADLIRGADFAKQIGAPAIITHCGFIPECPRCREYVEVLTAIYDVAYRCWENGIGFWFETGQETPLTLLRTIEDLGLPNLGINLDTANLFLYGRGNPVDALEIFGQHVRNLHIKDAILPKGGYVRGKEVPIGEGYVDFEKIIRKLYALNFQGELIIEREISGPEQQRDIRAAYGYIDRLLKKCAPDAAAKESGNV